MKKTYAEELLEKYASGNITEREKDILESWHLNQNIENAPNLSDEDRQKDMDQVWALLESEYSNNKHLKNIRLRRIAIAASVMLFLTIGTYFILHKTDADKQIVQNSISDIRPGNNKAVLHLANGRQIYLGGNKTGAIVQQVNTNISAANGQLVYRDKRSADNDMVMVYDTIVIPRGGQHELLLADGSKVWINAASAIRFPENFYGNERRVELLYGEAYFEVIHNTDKAFRVATRNQLVEDIGTHFNINAYNDEHNVKTTLLEGSVRVAHSGTSALLKPGERSVISKQSGAIKIEQADVDEAVAWKNGKFVFNNEDIQSIMRKISRWYDVDVVYAGGVSANEFNGSVSRFKSVSEVLRKLEETGTIHFKIDERRITVMP